MTPINMILHCPKCGMQHVDAPDRLEQIIHRESGTVVDEQWTNPPHRSHLCHGCGCIWRPADVPTNGVRAIATRGKADTWPDGVPVTSSGEIVTSSVTRAEDGHVVAAKKGDVND